MADKIMDIIKDPTLTYNQRYGALAKAAEDSIDPITPRLSPKTQEFLEKGIFFDMREGKAPYRPRYIVPNYDLFMQNGSEFLMLQKPKDIWDAVGNLMVLYHHVPSVTGMPVYMGHLDRLLEPYIDDIDQARHAIRILLTHMDRTMPDAFCHCDIGPIDTRAGRIILELTAEMQRPVPNMSMLYSSQTSDEFALKAIETTLVSAKPAFVNDELHSAEWGKDYAVASCYNILPLGGGGFTLCRMNMKKLALESGSLQRFMDETMPAAVLAQCELMDERIKFIIDDAEFFKHSFLVDEGLISQDKFVGMFGFVGLAECVNTLLGAADEADRFGHSDEATELADRILAKMHELVTGYRPKYGSLHLHAQVGVEDDYDTTPGTRIPVAEDLEMPQHLAITAKLHKYVSTGTGDIYPCDDTVKKNPAYLLDILKGSLGMGMRYISFYGSDSDVVRVTGYLVKRSDMEKLRGGEAVLENSTILGIGAVDCNRVLDRKVRSFYNA